MYAGFARIRRPGGGDRRHKPEFFTQEVLPPWKVSGEVRRDWGSEFFTREETEISELELRTIKLVQDFEQPVGSLVN